MIHYFFVSTTLIIVFVHDKITAKTSLKPNQVPWKIYDPAGVKA